MQLERVLETEVMDTQVEAHDYDNMDHSQVNGQFVADLLEFARSKQLALGNILDLGTGTARIPIQLCQTEPKCHVTAIDMAIHMLELAAANVDSNGLTKRIRLEQVDAKAMPYDDGLFDCSISNSIVHHIPEPDLCLAELIRVTKPGGIIFVRDLLRPRNEAMVNQLVQLYAGAENAHSRQMFDDSLRAALSIDEIREIVAGFGFEKESVSATSDRHWTWAVVRLNGSRSNRVSIQQPEG